MKQPYIPFEFPVDTLNRHYDDRPGWLSWNDVTPKRTSKRLSIGRMLVRIGHRLEGTPIDTR